MVAIPGLQPDIVMYSTLMTACSEVRQRARAHQLWGQALQRALSPAGDLHFALELSKCAISSASMSLHTDTSTIAI